TSSPFFRASTTLSVKASTAFLACSLVRPACSAMAATSSAFVVIFSLPARRSGQYVGNAPRRFERFRVAAQGKQILTTKKLPRQKPNRNFCTANSVFLRVYKKKSKIQRSNP